MSDDQNPDAPQVVAGRQIIRIAFCVGIAVLVGAAAMSRSGKRRAGRRPDGASAPEHTDSSPVSASAGPAVVTADAPAIEDPVPGDPATGQVEPEDGAVDEVSASDVPVPDEVVLFGKEPPDAAEHEDDPTAEAAPKRTRKGKRKRSTGGRVAFWIGIGMILAGLGLLGYVGWQLWGTNWVSHRQQRQVATQLEQEWSQDRGCTTNCPTGRATALIRIPKFGRDYEVPVLEGVRPDVLSKGFGHFKESADPGEVGNYALAGHRVTHGEPLRKLPQLRPGDEVIVETRTATYTYVLDTNPNDLIVPFTGVWVVAPLPKNPRAGGPQPAQVDGQRLITLTTCSEIFHTDNRMISFGHLVDTVSKVSTTASSGSP